MTSTANWQAAVVAHLRESKRARFDWPTAQALAARAVRIPASARYGTARIYAEADQSSLFDETGEAAHADTLAAFFWKAAENAYLDVIGAPGSGNGPALRYWSTGMLEGVRLEPVAA